MKTFILVLLSAVCLFAQSNYTPLNSILIYEDSTNIDSTQSKILPVIWQDNGGNMTILIESRNDSTAGFKDDSAAVSIEVLQVFPLNKSTSKNLSASPYLVSLPSRAHPDSSTYPFGSKFMLFDSLAIQAMDTVSVYARDYVSGSRGSRVYGDSVKAFVLTSAWGAFKYISVPFDYSPGVALKLTGKANNGKRGVGSFWRIRVYQLSGIASKSK